MNAPRTQRDRDGRKHACGRHGGTHEWRFRQWRPAGDLGVQRALADVLGQVVLRYHSRREIQVLMEADGDAAHGSWGPSEDTAWQVLADYCALSPPDLALNAHLALLEPKQGPLHSRRGTPQARPTC